VRARALRLARRAGAAAAAFAALSCANARDSLAQDGRAALRAGRYDEAVAALGRDAERGNADARRLLLRALGETGRYAQAESLGRRFAGPEPAGAQVANALGEVLYARGRVDEARAAFERALAGGAGDSLTARYNLAVLRFEAGEVGEAMRLFEQVAAAGQGGRLAADDLAAVGGAHRYLGRRDPQRFRLALRALDAAVAADSGAHDARVRLGELFLEKYNSPDARASFDAVLRANPRHPRALLGLARARQFDGEARAAEPAERSLATNPSLADAHVFLATLSLDAEDYAKAVEQVNRALAVDPAHPEALATLAAARHLAGDEAGAEAARRRALARNPRAGELYATMAELSARHRLYADAVRFATRAVALDPELWRAHSLLGINQLRAGSVDSARRSLERAFAGDPYDVWTKNTLDLLDATASYRTASTRRFALVGDTAELPLLSLYLGELMEEAYDRMAERYGYRPPAPVRLELYRRHADFSVRTVGLAGLGALGVSFGPVLAMDSPAAREIGRFNWGSTAWHELAHTFTLGATRNRVPRWLSEGVSVLEERRARPGWGDDATPSFLAAYQSGRVPPPSRLNDGFMRPAYPEQVIHAYYAASLVCEMIERQWGPRALPALLGAYRDGLRTDAAVQRVLQVDLPTLDRRFDAYVKERHAGALAAVGREGGADSPFGRALAAARAEGAAGREAEAIRAFERAKALFPEYAGEDSPYWELARIHERRGRAREAAAELSQLTARNGSDYQAHLKLAELLERTGDAAGAATALERAIYVSPYDVGVHQRLATLAAAQRDHRRAVRERRAVVALAPVDIADARYQLARALQQAGDVAAARREVLRALEEAPGFAPAQELLLELQPGGDRPAATTGGRAP
jgi:tetratricopeptide (TPR) repeat protein